MTGHVLGVLADVVLGIGGAYLAGCFLLGLFFELAWGACDLRARRRARPERVSDRQWRRFLADHDLPSGGRR